MRVYQKMQQILLQNATAILLQIAAEVYCKMRQVFYYKMRQLYYKMLQSFEIATILLQNATFITNCDSTIISLFLVFIGLIISCPYIQLPSRSFGLKPITGKHLSCFP